MSNTNLVTADNIPIEAPVDKPIEPQSLALPTFWMTYWKEIAFAGLLALVVGTYYVQKTRIAYYKGMYEAEQIETKTLKENNSTLEAQLTDQNRKIDDLAKSATVADKMIKDLNDELAKRKGKAAKTKEDALKANPVTQKEVIDFVDGLLENSTWKK